MCLAIPARIARLDGGGLATVDIMGVTRSISVDLTPQAGVDDYVLVHAGFAIEVVDETFAQETIDLIRQFPELVGDDLELVERMRNAEAEEPALGGVSTGADDAAERTGQSPVPTGVSEFPAYSSGSGAPSAADVLAELAAAADPASRA